MKKLKPLLQPFSVLCFLLLASSHCLQAAYSATVKGLRLQGTLPNSAYLIPLAFSPNSRILAVGGGNVGGTKYPGGVPGFVQLRQVANGQTIRTLRGHTNVIKTAAFSADGKLLVTGSEDTTIKLWNVATGRLLFTLTGHKLALSKVVFSSDGRAVASSSQDKTVKVWNVANGKLLRNLTGNKRTIYALTFANRNRVLVTGGWDGSLKLWNWRAGRSQLIGVERNPITHIALGKNDNLFTALTMNSVVKQWNVTSKEDVKSVTASPPWYFTVGDLAANSRFFARGYTNSPEWGQSYSEMNIVSVQTGKVVSSLSQTGHLLSPVLSHDGQLLAISGLRNAISIWRRT